MKTSRIVLIAMAGVALLLSVVAVAAPSVMRMFGPRGGDDGGVVSIAIASPLVMQIAAEQAAQQAQQAQAQPVQPANAVEGLTAAQTTQNNAVTQDGANATQAQQAQQAQQASALLQVLHGSSVDGLGTELAASLRRSGRFEVQEPSRFMTELQRISDRAAGDGEPQNFFETLAFWRRNTTTQTNANGQTQQTTNTEQGGATRQGGSGYDERDLQSAGQALGVRYVLVVWVGGEQATYQRSRDAYSDTSRGEYHLSPTLIYRVFDVRNGNFVLGTETAVNPAVRTNFRYGQEELMQRDLRVALNDRVAQIITRALLDELTPARIIAQDGDFTINRGSNDGIIVGQVYEVQRERERQRDLDARGRVGQGVELDARRDNVGQLRILEVFENSATATPVEGDFQIGDIVVVTPSRSRAIAASAAGGTQTGGLGVAQGSGGTRQRLAVGTFDVSLLEPQLWRYPGDTVSALQRRMAGNLGGDPRIEVLSRADLERAREERRLAAAAQGIQDADINIGMATAGHVLGGEVRLSARRSGETISVGGQSRQVNQVWRMTAEGTLRVQTIDGVLTHNLPISVTRNGNPQDATAVNALMDAFAQEASAQLLVRLFPIEVAQITGDNIVLNRGAEAGLRANQRLRAYRAGAVITDRHTGRQIGGARTLVGELIVTDAPTGGLATARFAAARFNLQVGDVLEISGAAPAATQQRRQQSTQSAEPAPEEQKQRVQW